MSDGVVHKGCGEFIIEAGSNEMAPSHQRQSFFTIERYGDPVGEAEIFFLGHTYESPEQD
jgi:hypothetical protein